MKLFLLIAILTCQRCQIKTIAENFQNNSSFLLAPATRNKDFNDDFATDLNFKDDDSTLSNLTEVKNKIFNLENALDHCKSLKQDISSPKVTFYKRSADSKSEFLQNPLQRDYYYYFKHDELELICTASYPIEWTFSMQMVNNWTYKEGRDWSLDNRSTITDELYTAKISYYPGYPENQIHSEFTCRSVMNKTCLQSTITLTAIDDLSDRSGNTLDINILEGEPLGEYVPQYSRNEGTNGHCLITLTYNEDEGEFICSSKSENNLILEVANWVTIQNCFDPFTCTTLYNIESTARCKLNHESHNDSIETPLTLSLDNTIQKAGLVICKPAEQARTETGGFMGLSLELDKYSAALPFFHSFTNICGEDVGYKRHLYADFDVPQARALEFLSICPSIFEVYLGGVIEVQCLSSVYYFADGMRIIKKLRNGKVQILSMDEAHAVDEKSKYRIYLSRFRIFDVNIIAIACEAPVRKTTSWIRQEAVVNLLASPNDVQSIFNSESHFIRFEGGDSPVMIKYKSGKSIICTAKGSPSPRLTWKGSDEPLNPYLKQYGNEAQGYIVLVLPIQPSSFYGKFLCVAETEYEKKVKVFIVGDLDDDIEKQSSNTFIWAIVSVVFVTIAVIFAVLNWKLRRRNKQRQLLTTAEVEEFMNGRPEMLCQEKNCEDYDVYSYAACLPYDKNIEVLKQQFEIDKNVILGFGAYGMVYAGILKLSNGDFLKAAIKTVKPMVDVSHFKTLLAEIKIMGFFGKHANIVNLLGAHTKNIQKQELFILLEYCENGSLINYLKQHRFEFDNYVEEGMLQLNEKLSLFPISKQSQKLNTLTLLKWGFQIANGMDFLCRKKVIHGDVAARNILLSHDLTAKIGDFGLARQLIEYANYIKKTKSPLPWKWLALECLQDMSFSTKSDVWAYGITLWEIFSLGQCPYPGLSYNFEFVDSLVRGIRPPRPQYAYEELYDLMQSCWTVEPTKRPSFYEISKNLYETIKKIVQEEYVELEDLPTNRDTN